EKHDGAGFTVSQRPCPCLPTYRWVTPHVPHCATSTQVPPKVTPPTPATRGTEECGRSAAPSTLCTRSKLPILLAKMTVAALHRAPRFSTASGVDFCAPE